jgi:hypothetical protein
VEDSEAEGGQGLQSSTHRERFLWRIDQFERLGFNEAEASDLADSDADLGQARHLLATGCSSTLALQILLWPRPHLAKPLEKRGPQEACAADQAPR